MGWFREEENNASLYDARTLAVRAPRRFRMKARWYFDFVSPFSYLHLKLFDRIAVPLEIEPVPVLFAGLLKSAGQKGPAEIPAKRVQTYRYCTWLAREER